MITISRCALALSVMLSIGRCVVPVSRAEFDGLMCGMDRYATPGAWSSEELQLIKDTLVLDAKDYNAVQNEVIPNTINDNECTIRTFEQVDGVVKKCTNISISDLSVPGGKMLDLTKLLPGSFVTFTGRTQFLNSGSKYTGTLMLFSGTNITLQGAPCSVIDGNGGLWWDTIGTNGGVPKPHFIITAKSLRGNSFIQNLYIKNAPAHVMSITNSVNVTVKGNIIDLIDGEAIQKNGKAAGHNTDGFGTASCTNLYITNSAVWNQDDCVAVTSGSNIFAGNLYCKGGHGLSIGSVGGKSDNVVDGVLFRDSYVVNSQNGCRIKANAGTVGSVNNITWQNITLANISVVGVTMQADYLNGGPTGNPTNGVNMTNISVLDVRGWVQSVKKTKNYHILVGNNTLGDTWTFRNVNVTGGGKTSDCNIDIDGFSCQ